MKVGDEVIVIEENIATKIIGRAYDEQGVEVFMLEGSCKDYYEKDLYLVDLEKAIEKLEETKDNFDIQIVLKRLKEAEEDLQLMDHLMYKIIARAERVYAGFFMHIRTKIVEPKGKELGKTDKEISQMTVDTINVYLNEKFDEDAANAFLKELENDMSEVDEISKDEGDHIPNIE